MASSVVFTKRIATSFDHPPFTMRVGTSRIPGHSGAGTARNFQNHMRFSARTLSSPVRTVFTLDKAFPKCRVIGMTNPAFPGIASGAPNCPQLLNLLFEHLGRTDSNCPVLTPPQDRHRHNGNGQRTIGNDQPTFQERSVRHYGNEYSTLWEQRHVPDSPHSGLFRPFA